MVLVNESPISRFEILGLHGDRDVILDLDAPIKILVDENGAGKTTVINILVSILQGDLYKVGKYTFQEIRIHFRNQKVVEFEHSDFDINLGESAHPILIEVYSRYPREWFVELVDSVQRYPYTELRRRGLLEHIADEMGVPTRLLYDAIRKSGLGKISSASSKQLSLFDEMEGVDSQIARKIDTIKDLFPYRVLYFPTYRLVEENLQSLGYPEVNLSSGMRRLIQFGMQDVRKRWDSLTDEIRRSAVQWFSKISGSMLDELTDGIQKDSIEYESIENSKNALKIVLDRGGENIAPHKKERILELVESGQIRERQYEPLAYFLSKLIKVYEQQQVKDNAIKSCVRIINSYFADKEIMYEESELDIQVFNKRTRKPMGLDHLSSGEKQIVSIFTRLYMGTGDSEQYAIFFDEPELSLSMEWQKMLLQNISDSERCVFLLAATHSPFIFENQLAKFADVLKVEFIEGN